MIRFFRFFIPILFLVFLTDCQTRKDDSVERAVFNYILLCPGGNPSACTQTCSDRFGSEVTTENFSAVDRCVSSCQSNCNLQNLFLLLESQN